VRTTFHLSVEILTALFFAASIGVGAGVAAISFTHRLGDGVRVAVAAFLVASATFGYLIWRTYRPEQKAAAPRSRSLEVASSR
jgi:membrane protein implicated in regulation of membrane protease activity